MALEKGRLRQYWCSKNSAHCTRQTRNATKRQKCLALESTQDQILALAFSGCGWAVHVDHNRRNGRGLPGKWSACNSSHPLVPCS
ncbi:hypothetical protein KQX54_017175 [Cotesia glomerata]|uniref:Uncharacterized protein n=1 Tax=Cotesia glomerata TaxID=32391 RepID=A0AAV7IG46_COTGL|nr:hypothetical protein KQX54_017175 [Cotesia glomerata]